MSDCSMKNNSGAQIEFGNFEPIKQKFQEIDLKKLKFSRNRISQN